MTFEITRRSLVVLAAAASLAGCGALKPDPAVTLQAEEAYVLLAAEKYDDLYKRFAPAYRNAELMEAMPKMHRAVPPGAPAGPPVLAGWKFTNGTDGSTRDVAFVYTYPEMETFTTVETKFTGSEKDGWTLAGMFVESESGDYAEGVNLGKGAITPPPRTDITVAQVKAAQQKP